MIKMNAGIAIQTIFPYLDMRPEVISKQTGKLHAALPNSCYSFNTAGPIVKKYWPEESTDD